MNVLVVAEESAGIQLLRLLAQTHHRIVAVLTSPSAQGDGGATVRRVAERMGYATWPSKLVRDPNFARTVCSERVDILLNVHSLYIIHGSVLSAPRIGSFNLHPGPLPSYAGLNTVSWALYRGETRYGTSLHKMVPEVDVGPIVFQSFFQIEEGDSALAVYAKCIRAGLPLVLQMLETASKEPEAIPLIPQDLTKRRYFGREVPENGRITWTRPAREIANFVRACDYYPFQSPWGHPVASMENREITVAQASLTGAACDALPGTIGECEGSGVYIACADEWIWVGKVMLHGRPVDPAQIFKHRERRSNRGSPAEKAISKVFS